MFFIQLPSCCFVLFVFLRNRERGKHNQRVLHCHTRTPGQPGPAGDGETYLSNTRGRNKRRHDTYHGQSVFWYRTSNFVVTFCCNFVAGNSDVPLLPRTVMLHCDKLAWGQNLQTQNLHNARRYTNRALAPLQELDARHQSCTTVVSCCAKLKSSFPGHDDNNHASQQNAAS